MRLLFVESERDELNAELLYLAHDKRHSAYEV